MDTNEHDRQHGLLQSTVEMFLDSTRTLAELATRTSSAGVRALVPDPVLVQVNQMLLSLRQVVEQAPQLTDEIDVLLSELHAKRLSIQAMTAELTALDQQLEILERTLAPVEAWNGRWQQLQQTLLHLELPTEETTG